MTVRSSGSGPLQLELSVSGSSGCIERYSLGGGALLAAPLEPCFTRAATDNDRGGMCGSSYAARWAAAGLDRLEAHGERGEMQRGRGRGWREGGEMRRGRGRREGGGGRGAWPAAT